jgi:hypothetical protein
MITSGDKKEKLTIKNDVGRGKDYFMIHFGVLNKEKALQHYATLEVYFTKMIISI